MRFVAQFLSVLFHPLLILTYTLVLMLIINPYSFGVSSISDQTSKELILVTFIQSSFIPGLIIVLLPLIGFVSSLEFPTREDRIIPFIIAGMLYLWFFINILNRSDVPRIFATFTLGTTIALFLAFIINIFSKISVHTVGMGGWLAMMLILYIMVQNDTILVSSTIMGNFQFSVIFVMLAIILIAGTIGTARLLLEAHRPPDLYGGYLVGFTAQFIALQFVL